ncbi:protein of unknown function DUF4774 [Streptomyces phage Coruscant]|uniref:Uncharacterized protein n=1 Tax=Streptomyces phage Coruscant TaxID=2739834 RepID=A0A7G4AW41_9CAUD|nr:protein of unknown function DUF4774 [Streptomyces phage Coruscant]QMP84231.1 protein of unknown function DUF4774 [Streptomyces phage Coruscant]
MWPFSKKKIENTGNAVSDGTGTANTGFKGTLPKGAKIKVKNTGDAVATNGGYANSGIDYSDE